MTLYSVLVANSALQTVDCTGIAEITVRELKNYIQLQKVQQHSLGI